MKLRKDLAAKDTKKSLPAKADDALRSEVELYGGQLIHYDDGRLQAIKNRPQYYSLENMSYEDLESLIEAHREELKSSHLYSRGPNGDIGDIPEELKSLSYEEVVRLRVSVKQL